MRQAFRSTFLRTKASVAMIPTPLPKDINPKEVVEKFAGAVNLAPDEMETFLDTRLHSEGSNCAAKAGPEERHLARRVVELLQKLGDHKSDPHFYDTSLLYENDLEMMNCVADHIAEKVKEGPPPEGASDEEKESWRCHLMTYGYDPLRERKGKQYYNIRWSE